MKQQKSFMNSTFLDLSNRIDPTLIDIFSTISKVAERQGISFFVIGATARDIVLECAYGIRPARATRDLDLGVKVADWLEFQKLSNALVETDMFRISSSAQRFFYTTGLPVDIVPFGKIAGNSTSIAWPPRHDVELDLLGFAESFSNALLIRLSNDPQLEIPFASPAGWSLMKIISWNDREGEARAKDAHDLSLILGRYAEAGNENRLYGPEAQLMEEEEYDLEKSGARLLGRDIAAISSKKSLKKILWILERETGNRKKYEMAENMVQNRIFYEEEFNRNLGLLEKLKQGILEALQEKDSQMPEHKASG